MAPDRTGKSVFLGNIPYNLTEEQVKDILSTAGTVTKFRLMMNPETGKPKGYGFADFADADAAASAVRNLNDYEIMGRKIRVDWPHNNEKDSIPADYPQQTQPMDQDPVQQMQQIPGAAPLPPLPPGVEIPPHLDCPNAISHTLASLPPSQLLDVLTQMKQLAVADPARATELLRQAPQLAYAIFQALLLMNLVEYQLLGSIVEQAAQPVTHQQAAPQYQPYGAMPGQVGTPPVGGGPFAPPTAQAAQPQVAGQEELLQQVLSMPQSAIDALPPTERSQIMLLRQQLMQGGMR
ncbi:hypothetical protein N7462_009105 [Penicillium macrosclerotiorum]|uniref:uncharacterized protein n=1 Tax=Penicillium macrosclerotiorum TaxID=303699 RepID=UPI0025482913|nr:uncharacterized protein N7462_009105 [Penicillium macrosclerotiorum]KAJ5676208.1 hypothetical protein N7462_009105 [Penicillium macrosclerotiorum]